MRIWPEPGFNTETSVGATKSEQEFRPGRLLPGRFVESAVHDALRRSAVDLIGLHGKQAGQHGKERSHISPGISWG